ncbi:MAG TPA: hypothetical protein VKA15_09205 [Isosphaeraceae bacterium]|nr:hypothetical protein [Isosphaeraceae bacterium]
MGRRSIEETGVLSIGAKVPLTADTKKMTSEIIRKIEDLSTERDYLHRFTPPRPLRDAAQAAEYIRERSVVMLSGKSALPSLPESIAGRKLAGSWMADPEAKRIYELLQSVCGMEFVEVRLVEGKLTLIDESLGSAVQRLAVDPSRRARALASLSKVSSKLLEQIESEGALMMDETGLSTKEAREARLELERHFLAVSRSIHTSRGHHVSKLLPWGQSTIAARFELPSRQLDLSEALNQIFTACIHSAVLALEKEAHRWFDFAPLCISELTKAGELEMLRGDRNWLTAANRATVAEPDRL